MYTGIVVLAPAGPPFVVRWIESRTLNDQREPTSPRANSTRCSSGKVIAQKLRQAFAPSMVAASITSFGTVASAPYITTALSGNQCQLLTRMTVMSENAPSANGAPTSIPTPAKILYTTPYLLLSIHCQITATATVGTAHGSMIQVRALVDHQPLR